MNNIELKRNFIEWVESKSGEPFPNHPLLGAILDENSELFINSTINEVSFIQHYDIPELYIELFSYWENGCKAFLKREQRPNVQVTFRGVQANLSSGEADEQLKILSKLHAVCL